MAGGAAIASQTWPSGLGGSGWRGFVSHAAVPSWLLRRAERTCGASAAQRGRCHHRVLHRAVALKKLTEAEAADRHAHLISVLVARSAVVGLRLLSLNDRVRQAARGLGLAVEPS